MLIIRLDLQWIRRGILYLNWIFVYLKMSFFCEHNNSYCAFPNGFRRCLCSRVKWRTQFRSQSHTHLWLFSLSSFCPSLSLTFKDSRRICLMYHLSCLETHIFLKNVIFKCDLFIIFPCSFCPAPFSFAFFKSWIKYSISIFHVIIFSSFIDLFSFSLNFWEILLHYLLLSRWLCPFFQLLAIAFVMISNVIILFSFVPLFVMSSHCSYN